MADGLDAGIAEGLVNGLTQFMDMGAQGAAAGSGVSPERVFQLFPRHDAGRGLEQRMRNPVGLRRSSRPCRVTRWAATSASMPAKRSVPPPAVGAPL